MRSLTEKVVAALGVEDTEAGDDVDTASSAVVIGARVTAPAECVDSTVLVVVFSVAIFFFVVVVVVSRWQRKMTHKQPGRVKNEHNSCRKSEFNLNICWIHEPITYT